MRIIVRKPRWWRRRQGDDELPPVSPRQRLIVAAAAVLTTLAVVAAMLAPQLELMRAKQQAAQPRPCAPGQTRDCIGGALDATIVAPAASASAR